MKIIKRLLFAFLLFTGFSINYIYAQNEKISTYHIENPEILEKSNLEIHTNWDFFWGRFIPPYDKSASPDLVVSAPSDWNKYNLSDEIKNITKIY